VSVKGCPISTVHRITLRQPRPAGKSDLDRLLSDLTENEPDLRRAIALGAYAGLRVSEAAALDWSTVDEEARLIYVTGKGSKERVVAISAVLWDWLLPELAAGNVVTAGGRAYAGDTLQRRINRLMKASGIGHTYHDLRKRGATLALSRTKNPVAVAQMFGWESLQTAQHYAQFDGDVLREIAEAMV
jgi:integrase